MSDHLIFSMGKYEARIPTDRSYARNHMWLQKAGEAYRVGLSAYAVRLLQDVYFLAWSVEPGVVVRVKQELGEIESSKAVSDIYAPASGTLLRFNGDLLRDPTPINVDTYGTGWLFEFALGSVELMAAEDYLTYLAGTWTDAERHIKGQMND
ncbi:MAG TPA: glycine cleavage system protein H [Pyrinomonadaceae bacterium]|nr:glycine cleavage system protein H [Pyrinomonadaceae bacterium]